MPNYNTLITFFITTLILSFLSFYYFRKKNYYLDKPDHLSVHLENTPTCAGIIFFVLTCLGLSLFFFFENEKILSSLPNRYYIFFFSYIILFLISLYDDLKNLNAIYRLITQIVLIFF